MRKTLVFLFVICFSTICWDTPAFAGGGTTCSLSVSAPEIIAGQTASWTATSNPAGLPYFWYVNGPLGQQSTVPGAGRITPWTEKYTYDTPGVYSVFFIVTDSAGNTVCTSNVATLTVDSVFVTGTNFFPNGGTFVPGENDDIRIYLNAATGITVNWFVVVADDELVGARNKPAVPFQFYWGTGGFKQTVGTHRLFIIMDTSVGQFQNEADYEIISDATATPHQIAPASLCLSTALPGVCIPAPPPPNLPGVGDMK